ncbi:hypothetical protein [Maridesulfovibrio sp.]|uniref:hypothetical protein n=1 Tax=Maridesulfovibrio sp. TaxID=2795000 RepID=UPI0029F46CE8|nr:hypothetical protein [Maridesulfovibrio sp.]
MTEILVVSISLIIFAFIIYSTYSAQNAKLAQKKKAFELKQAHMEKSKDKVRSEISLIEKEIARTEAKLNDLNQHWDDA